jgi:hypothetical protein
MFIGVRCDMPPNTKNKKRRVGSSRTSQNRRPQIAGAKKGRRVGGRWWDLIGGM